MDYKEKYEQLDNAVKDLLSELRIDEDELTIMASGYSPNYPGVKDEIKGEDIPTSSCMVQLSKITASKLKESMNFDYLNGSS